MAKLLSKLKRTINKFQIYFAAGVVVFLFVGSLRRENGVIGNQGLDTYSANILTLVEKGLTKDIPFNWNQVMGIDRFVVDNEKLLSKLNCEEFASRIKKTDRTRYNCHDDSEDEKFPFTMKENVLLYLSEFERNIMAKNYLLKSMPNPTHLIYMFPNKFLTLPVSSNPTELTLTPMDLKNQVLFVSGNEESESLLSHSSLGVKTLSYDMFNYKELLNSHDDANKVKLVHNQYPGLKRARRYFSEAFLSNKENYSFLDWRFFNSSAILDPEKELENGKTLTIHRLIRAWLHLSEQLDLDTWLAGESTLGWFYTGTHLPFTDEVKFEVTMDSLLKLIDLNLNHSIIFDYLDFQQHDIKGEYFLDINPYFKLRDKNNGENLNDIRLIDIHTGMYVVINALSSFQYQKLFSFEKKSLLQSLTDSEIIKIQNYIKNYKDDQETLLIDKFKTITIRKFDDYRTLVPVKFENYITYVPHKLVDILKDDYLAPFRGQMNGYSFIPGPQMWLSLKTFPQPSEQEEPNLQRLDDITRYYYEKTKAYFESHKKLVYNFNENSNKFNAYKMTVGDVAPLY